MAKIKSDFATRMAEAKAKKAAERAAAAAKAETADQPEAPEKPEKQVEKKAKPVRSQKTLVRKLISQIAAKLAGDVGKATLADLIKLLQIEKELPAEQEEETKEIRVMWVDPDKLEKP